MDLKLLKELSDLKFQNSEQIVSRVLQRENTLRAELARLRDMVKETQEQLPQHSHIRAVGADVIWLKWVEKMQRELTLSLANVLAEKERLMAQHRQAHGRKLVSDTMARQQANSQRSTTARQQLQSAIDSSVNKISDQ